MAFEKLTGWLREEVLKLDLSTEYSQSDPSVSRADIEQTVSGGWAWIHARGKGSGDNDAPWSDSWSNHWYKGVYWDWVGPVETVPEDPTSDALNEWAVLKAHYTFEDWKFELSDIRHSHEGQFIESLNENGTATIATATKPESDSAELADAITRSEQIL